MLPHYNKPTMAAKMSPIPNGRYVALLALLSGHALIGGYFAATRPEGAGWRFFSWHPFLMMVGMYVHMLHIFMREVQGIDVLGRG